MKVTLLKYRDLGLKALMKFRTWASHQVTLDEGNLIDPSLLVVEAKNAADETIAFCTVQPVLLVSTYVVNPTVTSEVAQRAGDYMNAAIESEAHLRRISKCLLVTPRGITPKGAVVIPTIEHKVQQPSNLAMECLTPFTEELSQYVH